VEYIDEHPAAVLSDIKHHLCEAFAFSGDLSNVMDVLNKHKIQGYHLVWTMRQSTRRLRYVILLKVGIIDIFHRTLLFEPHRGVLVKNQGWG
jgi:hypothetical protein